MSSQKIDEIVKRGYDRLERSYAAEVGKPGEARSSYDPSRSHYKIVKQSRHEKID